MYSPQRSCPACGRRIESARFEDKISGVVYHPMCFMRGIAWVSAPLPAPVEPERTVDTDVETVDTDVEVLAPVGA
jgi:hypothetical protein